MATTANNGVHQWEEPPLAYAYVRPYVNQRLKGHPLGKEFRIIRELCSCYPEGPRLILYLLNNSIPYEGPYSNFYINKFVRIIISFLSGQGRETSPDGRTGRLCAEEAKTRTQILLTQLDKSRESQWLVTYMLEDPLTRVTTNHNIPPEDSYYGPVIKMLERYLKDCQP